MARGSRRRRRPRSKVPDKVITAEQRAFWSFQPLQKPMVPAVSHGSWPKSDIDRFVLARLEKDGLTPVRAADKRTLIRRATLDLTGLPPTYEEIEAFEKDSSAGAFAKVVDRLLASPQYGERWGRYWLDVARYGEDDSAQPRSRRTRLRAVSERVPVSRLGGQGLQRRSAVRPVRPRAAGRRPARRAHARPDAARARAARPRPLVLRQRLGRDHARRRAARSRRRRVARLPRPHRRVRALPRSQVRPDPREGLLRAGRRLPELRTTTSIRSRRRRSSRSTTRRRRRSSRRRSCSTSSSRPRAAQLAETLAFSASSYMQSAWKVTGEPKKDDGARRQRGQARLRAVRALDPLPGQAAEVLPVPHRRGRR